MAARSDQLRRRLELAGLTADRTSGGHLRVVCPNGRNVIASATPSDHRAVKNLAAMLRRNGAEVHWRELV